jgi:hypothetical protein
MATTCWKSRAEFAGFDCTMDYEVELCDNLPPPGQLWDLTAQDERAVDVAWDEYVGAICIEPDGHAGPHRFTPQSEILLVFA